MDVKVLHTYVEVLGLGGLRLRGFGPKSLSLRLNPKPFSRRGNLQGWKVGLEASGAFRSLPEGALGAEELKALNFGSHGAMSISRCSNFGHLDSPSTSSRKVRPVCQTRFGLFGLEHPKERERKDLIMQPPMSVRMLMRSYRIVGL